ncbi:RagB/SusD family nutrient uptake outer membrane protein [Sinomicrobium sp. M5D2P9]
MMKKHLTYSLLWLSSISLLVSCQSFLDEVPDNRTEIDTPEKISELLTGAYPSGNYFMIAESMSDNAGAKPVESNNRINTEMYHWRDINDDSQDTPTYYWNSCYAAIAQANHALESIKELGEGNNLNPQKGEALMARAYAYFMLVNFWSRPYDPETSSSELGVPVITEPEKEVLVEYDRGTVQDVYNQIEKDILEGLPLTTDNYEKPKFHFTPHAARAFATRFFLFKGDWQKVIAYANEVLGSDPSKNLRSWNDDYVGLQYSEITIRYQSSEEPANLLISSSNSLYARSWSSVTYGLSVAKLNELFTSPSHPLGSWAYPVYGTENVYNIPKFDEYFEITNLSAAVGNAHAMSVLLSYDEVLLNRAEAHAMQGENEAAIRDINTFFSRKTGNYNPENLLTQKEIDDFYTVTPGEFNPFYTIPGSQLSIIKCIAELRRREFYHEGMRWLDNKRFRMEVRHDDAFGNISVLSADDPRRELQIPQAAQATGMIANPR